MAVITPFRPYTLEEWRAITKEVLENMTPAQRKALDKSISKIVEALNGPEAPKR